MSDGQLYRSGVANDHRDDEMAEHRIPVSTQVVQVVQPDEGGFPQHGPFLKRPMSSGDMTASFKMEKPQTKSHDYVGTHRNHDSATLKAKLNGQTHQDLIAQPSIQSADPPAEESVTEGFAFDRLNANMLQKHDGRSPTTDSKVKLRNVLVSEHNQNAWNSSRGLSEDQRTESFPPGQRMSTRAANSYPTSSIEQRIAPTNAIPDPGGAANESKSRHKKKVRYQASSHQARETELQPAYASPTVGRGMITEDIEKHHDDGAGQPPQALHQSNHVTSSSTQNDMSAPHYHAAELRQHTLHATNSEQHYMQPLHHHALQDQVQSNPDEPRNEFVSPPAAAVKRAHSAPTHPPSHSSGVVTGREMSSGIERRHTEQATGRSINRASASEDVCLPQNLPPVVQSADQRATDVQHMNEGNSGGNPDRSGIGKVRQQKAKSKSSTQQRHNPTTQPTEPCGSFVIAQILERTIKQELDEKEKEMSSMMQRLRQRELEVIDLNAYATSLSERLTAAGALNADLGKQQEVNQRALSSWTKKADGLVKYMRGLDSDYQRLKQEHNEGNANHQALCAESELYRAEREQMQNDIDEAFQNSTKVKEYYDRYILNLQQALSDRTKYNADLEKRLNEKVGELIEERDRCVRFEMQLKEAQDTNKGYLEAFNRLQEEQSEKIKVLSGEGSREPSLDDNSQKHLQECLRILHGLQTGSSVEKGVESIEKLLGSIEERVVSRIDQSRPPPKDISSEEHTIKSTLREQWNEIRSDLTAREESLQRIAMLEVSVSTLEQRGKEQEKRALEILQERDSLRVREAALKDRILQLETEIEMTKKSLLPPPEKVREDQIENIQIAMLRNNLAIVTAELEAGVTGRLAHAAVVKSLKEEADELRVKLGGAENKVAMLDTTKAEFDRQVAVRVKNEKEKNRSYTDQLERQRKMEWDNKERHLSQAKLQLEEKLTAEVANRSASENQLVRLGATITSLQQKIDKMDKESSNQEAKDNKDLEAVRKREDRAAKEIHELRQEVTEGKKALIKLEDKITHERKQSESALEQLRQQHEKELESLQLQVKKHESEFANIQGRITDDAHLRTQLQTKLDETQHNLDQSHKIIHDVNQQIMKIQLERDTLRQKMSSLLELHRTQQSSVSRRDSQGHDISQASQINNGEHSSASDLGGVALVPGSDSQPPVKRRLKAANRHSTSLPGVGVVIPVEETVEIDKSNLSQAVVTGIQLESQSQSQRSEDVPQFESQPISPSQFQPNSQSSLFESLEEVHLKNTITKSMDTSARGNSFKPQSTFRTFNDGLYASELSPDVANDGANLPRGIRERSRPSGSGAVRERPRQTENSHSDKAPSTPSNTSATRNTLTTLEKSNPGSSNPGANAGQLARRTSTKQAVILTPSIDKLQASYGGTDQKPAGIPKFQPQPHNRASTARTNPSILKRGQSSTEVDAASSSKRLKLSQPSKSPSMFAHRPDSSASHVSHSSNAMSPAYRPSNSYRPNSSAGSAVSRRPSTRTASNTANMKMKNTFQRERGK